jgi:7-keto-8-aminopelargonate synthetase-like enzyme
LLAFPRALTAALAYTSPVMSLSPPLQQVDRTYVRANHRRLSYFAGCDYFRLSSHPQVLAAAASGLKKFGLNVSASRLTTGNHQLYEQLERSIASFFQAETATLASSGYAPNIIVAQALAGQFSHALIDERAHGSLLNAAQFLDCPVIKFKYRDTTDLVRIIERLGNVKPILLTDGMFSHDGQVAPLKEYLKILPKGAMTLVDDAHGAGVLGKNGRGSLEHEGVSRAGIIQTITLSKAFGVYGGAVLGPAEMRSAILAKSRYFGGNTPLPLPLANAALKSIAILKTDPKLRQRLFQNTAYVKDKLCVANFSLVASPSPIISYLPRDAQDAARLQRRLLAHGVHPPFIKYPGGPVSGYFRFTISSEHTRKQLDDLVAALQA